jgi:hypothetical protein
MVIKRITMLLFLLGAAGGVYWWFRPVSDETRIKRMFSTLSELATRPEGEGASGMAYRTHRLASLFADPCELDVTYAFLSGFYSRSEITANAARARARFRHVDLDFFDLSVSPAEGNRTKAIFTVRLVGLLKSGERISEVREMEADLEKRENEWLFTRFRMIDVLQK